jgi:hypothetical protein
MTIVSARVREAHPAIIADTMADPRLSYWIAVGDNNGWGRSNKTEAEAIKHMNNNGIGKAKRYRLYRCTPNTTLNEMGTGFVRPVDEPAAVLIRQVG